MSDLIRQATPSPGHKRHKSKRRKPYVPTNNVIRSLLMWVWATSTGNMLKHAAPPPRPCELVCDVQITDIGCHRLVVSLEALPVLTSLDLAHNPFGEDGCKSLAILLSQPRCLLESLAIAGCLDVDPGAWKTFCPPTRAQESDEKGMRWTPPRPGDDGTVLFAAALMSPHGCPLRYALVFNRLECPCGNTYFVKGKITVHSWVNNLGCFEVIVLNTS